MSSPQSLPGRFAGRPLPKAASRRRSNEIRVVGMDWAWMCFFAFISVFVGLRTGTIMGGGKADLSALWMPLVSIGAYLAALGLRDRYAAVVAGALTASSSTLAAVCASSPLNGLALASVALAWRFYDADLLVLSTVACSIAFLCRPEMLVMGLVVVGYGIVQRKPQVGAAAAVFVAVVVVELTTHVWIGKKILLADDVASHGPYTVLWACGPAIMWFLTAFLTELSDKLLRPRWLPLATWLVLFVVTGCALDRTSSVEFFAPAFVACYLLSAAGVARVLPALAGDLPTPVARYVVATLAVLLLLGIRFPSDKHASEELITSRQGKVTIAHRLA